MANDAEQSFDVVHVAAEERHLHDRHGRDRPDEVGEETAFPPRDRLEIGEIRDELAPGRTARGVVVGSRIRRRPECGMDPVDDERVDGAVTPAELVDEEAGVVDRVAPGGGDEDESRRSLSEQPLDPCGTIPEALLHALEHAEEGEGVVDDLRAGDAAIDRRTSWPARLAARRYDVPGVTNTLKIRLSRKRSTRRGASRNSRARHVGGVSTTTRSKVACSCSSNSFSVAMYSWVPDSTEARFR